MSERTTVPLHPDTKERLDDLLESQPGKSYDGRLSALLDDYEAMLAEWDHDPLDTSGVTTDDLDGLRDDLLASLPRAVADEIENRRP